MLNVMYSVCKKEAHAECHYAERRYAECRGAVCPAVGDEDKKSFTTPTPGAPVPTVPEVSPLAQSKSGI